MANPVVNGSMIKCSMACALPPGAPVPRSPSYPPGPPANFLVPPTNRVMSGNKPVATIMDNVILPFQMSCMSQSNPTVQAASTAATAAAFGTPMFVPAPCTPIVGMWSPGCQKCRISKKNMLNSTSKLTCAMGGTIEIVSTPAMMVKIP